MSTTKHWQLALADSIPHYRQKGSYDYPATGRQFRRLLERQARALLKRERKRRRANR